MCDDGWGGMKQAAIPSAGFSAKSWCREATDSMHVGICAMPLASVMDFKAGCCDLWLQVSQNRTCALVKKNGSLT